MGLDEYQLQHELAKGSTGTVHRAVHRPTGTLVAIKRMPAPEAWMVRAVEQEVRAMAQVRHPNLLGIYDHGRLLDGEGLWLAMEYASGGSLGRWRPQSWAAVHGVLDDVLRGLAHAHARGLVHRDLKPGNLLVARAEDQSPGVKVGDFGLMTLRDEDPAVAFGGTPLYMAPEQWAEGPVLPATDLYALGCLLWRWLTGTRLFQGSMEELARHHAHSPVPSPRFAFPVPDAVAPLLRDLLAKDPADRPGTAGEVRRGLAGPSAPAATEKMLAPQPAVALVPPGMGESLLPLSDHVVVGRPHGKERMVGILQETVQTGRCHALLLSGAPGSGRTRMARWLAETAAELGVAVLLRAPGLLEAQAAAASGHVIALYDDLDPAVTEQVRNLLDAPAPILAIACIQQGQRTAVDGDARVHHIELGPMAPTAFRQFLQTQLGLSPSAARRLGRRSQGVPGIARAWVQDLSARGHLRPTPRGFELAGRIPPPPDLHHRERRLVELLLKQAAPRDRAAVRLAAMLGERVDEGLWQQVCQALGLERPEALLQELAAAGLWLAEGLGWRWTSQSARLAARGQPEPREWRAVADGFASLPPSPEHSIEHGLALLHAGDTQRARRVLLVQYPLRIRLMERVREAVDALAPVMLDATVTERVIHARLHLVCRLNLDGPADAESAADHLGALLGTVEDPGPWGRSCDPTVREDAMATVAVVWFYCRRQADARRMISGMTETPDLLRLAGLIAKSAGQWDTATQLLHQALRAAEGQDPACWLQCANDLGGMAGARGDVVEAERWFRRSLAVTDEASSFIQHLNIAMALVAQGRPADAVPFARRGLELADAASRDLPNAYVCYAFVAALAGRGDDVRRFGDTALAMIRRGACDLSASGPLVDAVRALHAEDLAIARFLAALRPLLEPGEPADESLP